MATERNRLKTLKAASKGEARDRDKNFTRTRDHPPSSNKIGLHQNLSSWQLKKTGEQNKPLVLRSLTNRSKGHEYNKRRRWISDGSVVTNWLSVGRYYLGFSERRRS